MAKLLPAVPRGTLGVFMQDSDCHWYFIPVEQVKAFDEANEKCNAAADGDVKTHVKLCGKFDDDYGKYRVGSYPGGYVVTWQDEERA